MEFLVLVVFALIAALIAHSRGRSPIGWAVIGFFAPCLALILVLVLPDLKLEEERRNRLRRENRRLSEQLKKERQVSDARHAQTLGRLGAHDAALGLDTSDGDPRAAVEGEAPPRLPKARGTDRDFAACRWHYALDEESGTEGPVPFDELKELRLQRVLDDDALVWTKGMGEWMALREMEDLRDELDRA